MYMNKLKQQSRALSCQYLIFNLHKFSRPTVSNYFTVTSKTHPASFRATGHPMTRAPYPLWNKNNKPASCKHHK